MHATTHRLRLRLPHGQRTDKGHGRGGGAAVDTEQAENEAWTHTYGQWVQPACLIPFACVLCLCCFVVFCCVVSRSVSSVADVQLFLVPVHASPATWLPQTYIMCAGGYAFAVEVLPADAASGQPTRVRFETRDKELTYATRNPDALEWEGEQAHRKATIQQLTAALASNEQAYAQAKKDGSLSDIGALALERDRIEEEVKVVRAALKRASESARPASHHMLSVARELVLPVGFARLDGTLYYIAHTPDIDTKSLPLRIKSQHE